ncbi:efflux RND transporter periplasmic adaptor subunit [Pseudomonas mangrovi]|jgi:membrane fusion protein (multidrug efflux system)|uniref:Efflux transporter periplasmic adaptor subunit n=1 Tax=Pseudomonas mangrovi TaxID=2161748 RepID=A0A2T5P705_9PSED|nr:efflux RND transporter periplasmic adaptor subunit [Pseudomonas mangrovi]PTU73520.1 efflux transporter periplasmic adaptor subunit [Pseudomonas mangrovi]
MFRSLHRLLFSVLALSAPAFANPPLVEVVQPELRLVRDELVTFGSLRSDESLMIRPEVDGRVAQLHFREGQAVSAGDLLVSLDDAITRAELAQAEANLSLAQKNYERAQRLFSRGASNAQARDEAQAEEQAASASLALARARLDKTRLHAPHDGVLGLRHVSPGDYLEAGQDIVNLEVLDPLKVEFRVPQKSAGRIRPGQRIEIAVDAWPDERFVGEVYAINPRVDEAGRSQALRAHVGNAERRLQPGQFVRVAVILAERPDALVVPEEALVPRGDKTQLALVEDGKAVFREVRSGRRKDGWVEIVEGLDAAEQVISAGWQKVSQGSEVRVRRVERSE